MVDWQIILASSGSIVTVLGTVFGTYGALMRKLGQQDAELEALKRESRWQSATMIKAYHDGKSPTVPPPRTNLPTLTEFEIDPWVGIIEQATINPKDKK
jgi:hypothetical protein